MKHEVNERSLQVDRFSHFFSKAGVFLFIAALIIVGSFVNANFLTPGNFMNIIQACSFLGIMCAGMAFVTYSGNYVDMSAPISIAISGIVAISFLKLGLLPACIIGVCCSVSIGLLNGFVVGKLRANPIIWTLAINYVLDGLIRWIYSNKQVFPDTDPTLDPLIAEGFINISRMKFLGMPVSVFVMIGLFALAQYVLSKTKFGNQLKLIGSNFEVARYSAINVTRSIITTYMIAGLAAGILGIYVASFSKVGVYFNGSGYEFASVTAIVLGGMTLLGGKGNMLGVLGGVFTVRLLSNVLTFIGIGTFVQNIVIGLVFILIVIQSSISLRRVGKDYA